MTIYGGGYLGFFGALARDAVILRLGIEDANIIGAEIYVGGLVGYNNNGTISNSYITGKVNSTGRYAGGLVGYNSGTISNNYTTVSVNGDHDVGGLVGSNNEGSVLNSYSTGSTTGISNVGGLVGSDLGTVSDSFWDIETSGTTVSDGGVGLSTSEIMNPYWLGLNGLGNNPNWVIDAGQDYPRLAWEGTAGQTVITPDVDWLIGNGTPTDPYCIDTSAQLIMLSKASILWDRHFLLREDVDLDPNLPNHFIFGQAVIPRFAGFFDGNRHIIYNLWIRGSNHLGLFGRLDAMAEIRNLGLESVNVVGTGRNIGGLTGENHGSISNSYSMGSVSRAGSAGSRDWLRSSGIGGLAGKNRGSISNSYSTGSVSASEWSAGPIGFVGGLLGRNSGTVSNSYATAMVNGGYYTGGLVGYNHLGTVLSSFWDIDTSGQNTSDGGTGKTTTEMQMTSTFLEAGWDFVDETANGTEDIWWILKGQDYPRLWWEIGDEASP
jgi:hypothetical protein